MTSAWEPVKSTEHNCDAWSIGHWLSPSGVDRWNCKRNCATAAAISSSIAAPMSAAARLASSVRPSLAAQSPFRRMVAPGISGRPNGVESAASVGRRLRWTSSGSSASMSDVSKFPAWPGESNPYDCRTEAAIAQYEAAAM